MVADMTTFTTKQLMRSPHDARHAARAYGYFMNHVKEGIDRNAQTREAAIEQGANILGVGLKMIEKILPKEAQGVFEKINEGLEWQKQRELDSVADAKKHLISSLDDMVVTSFKAIADPYGNLAAGNGDPAQVENYYEALEMFDRYYNH
jgi:hypothetical protein